MPENVTGGSDTPNVAVVTGQGKESPKMWYSVQN